MSFIGVATAIYYTGVAAFEIAAPYVAAGATAAVEAAPLAGAGLTAYGQIQQGETTKKVADYNAAVQRENAAQVAYKAKTTAEEKRVEGEALLSRQRVLYAKSGVAQEGTPMELMLGTSGDIEDDVFAILQKGQFGYQQGMESAGITEAEGETAKQGADLTAGGTLLTGLSRTASMGMNRLSPTIPSG